jgi:hypothetical protein
VRASCVTRVGYFECASNSANPISGYYYLSVFFLACSGGDSGVVDIDANQKPLRED